MNIENKSKEIMDEFTKKMAAASEEAISNCYAEIIPHVENDTYQNVNYRASAVIKNILAGNFETPSDKKGVRVKDDNGVSMIIKLTDNMYDNMRENLIKAMPECPKDLKIKSLELTIKHMQNQRSY